MMENEKTSKAFTQLLPVLEQFAREQGAENIANYAAELERLEEVGGYMWSVEDHKAGPAVTWPQYLTDFQIHLAKQLAHLAEILEYKDASK